MENINEKNKWKTELKIETPKPISIENKKSTDLKYLMDHFSKADLIGILALFFLYPYSICMHSTLFLHFQFAIPAY